MVATKQLRTIFVLAVPVIASVLGGYWWFRFPSPPSGPQADAFARQDALRYTTDEVCDDYRRWPVVYDFDAPVYTQTKYTLALMEALADVGFVTRKIVQNRSAGPVQFYPHEKLIYDISPRAKPYVREQHEQAGASGAGGPLKALCFGRYVYGGFISLETNLFVGDSSDSSQINGSVYKALDGSYRTDVRYSIRGASSFEDWANSVDMNLHGHKVRDKAEYYAYRRIGDLIFFADYDKSNYLERYVQLEHGWRGWKFAPKS